MFAYGVPIDVMEFIALFNHSIYHCEGKNEVIFPSANLGERLASHLGSAPIE